MAAGRKRSNLERCLSAFDDFPRSRLIKRSRSDDKATTGGSGAGADVGTSKKKKGSEMYGYEAPRLEDVGIVRALGRAGAVAECLADPSAWARARMFDDLPERRAGMNSTRTAEVLNFRQNVPALVTAAHVHALVAPGSSPSAAERDMAARVRTGSVRRVHVPLRGGRGVGGSGVSDMLVSTAELKSLLRRASGVPEATRRAYGGWLDAHPSAVTLSSLDLAREHVAALAQSGFLTIAASSSSSSSAAAARSAAAAAQDATAAKGTAISLETIAAAASGTAAAVGGPGGSLAHGAGGAGALQVRTTAATRAAVVYQIAVPNAGAYLKLLLAARSHVVELLRRSSRHELPLYLLKEYWDAGLGTRQAAAASATPNRDPFADLLPGQTKKWKAFYGMRFEWAFEEAFGGGLVECFDTGSVGLGVRLAS